MTTATMDAPKTKAGKATAITMPAASFREALTKVSPALAGATTIPVLKSIRVDAGDSVTTFTASNLELSIRATIYGGPTESVSVLLPSERLLAYAKLLDSEIVSLTPSERRIALRSGSAVTQFPASGVDNFPLTNFGLADERITLKQSQLLDLLRHTEFAISAEASRYTLHGALLECVGGSISLVATDGHRLSSFTVRVDGQKDTTLLLPGGFLKAMHKVLADCDEPVSLGAVGESVMCDIVSDSSVSMSHRMIVGSFPNYKAVVPSGAMAVAFDISVDELLASLSRCVAMADKKTGCIRLSFTPSKLVMKAADADAGETEEELEIEAAGEFAPFTTGFKGEYLTDVLKHIDGDCRFEFVDDKGQCALKITHTTDDGGELVYVVMPMRI